MSAKRSKTMVFEGTCGKPRNAGYHEGHLFTGKRHEYVKMACKINRKKFITGYNPPGVVTRKHWIERGV